MMLDTIDLAELNATACLQQRVDRKYLLDPASLDAFTERIADLARVLEIDGCTWFDYRSVYFDTPDLLCYHQAGRKRRRRFKTRTREYLSTGGTWLEVKTRGARGATIKDRIAHDGDGLDDADRTWIGATLTARGVDSAPVAALEPALTTHYTRRTLHIRSTDSQGPTRLTIDRNLNVELPASAPGGPLFADLSHLVVVETKGFPRPSVVDHLLQRSGHRPRSVSKYGIGTALLHPDTSTLKWNRLINTALAA